MKSDYLWICAVISVAILTMIPAVYSGSRSSRWAPSEQLKEAAVALDTLPLQFGPWSCRDSAPLAESARQLLKYETSISRTYFKQNNSTPLQCIMLVGLPGPLVRHPSEFCYEIRDNVMLEERVVSFDAGSVEHAVRLTRFQEPGRLQREFFVATGRFVNGRLGTSDTPRMTYGGEPFIYAFQVVWPITGDLEADEEVGLGFLNALLPAFQRHCLKSVRENVPQ